VERIEFAALEIVQGALLIDVRLLCLQTRRRGVLGVFGAVFLELEADGQLFGFDFGKFSGDFRADAFARSFSSTSCWSLACSYRCGPRR